MSPSITDAKLIPLQQVLSAFGRLRQFLPYNGILCHYKEGIFLVYLLKNHYLCVLEKRKRSTMKRVLKSEMARAAGVSLRTFQRWLRGHRGELLALGVKPQDHYLNPAAIKYVCEEYHVDPNDLPGKGGSP